MIKLAANYHSEPSKNSAKKKKKGSPRSLAKSVKCLSGQPNCPLDNRCTQEYYKTL